MSTCSDYGTCPYNLLHDGIRLTKMWAHKMICPDRPDKNITGSQPRFTGYNPLQSAEQRSFLRQTPSNLSKSKKREFRLQERRKRE